MFSQDLNTERVSQLMTAGGREFQVATDLSFMLRTFGVHLLRGNWCNGFWPVLHVTMGVVALALFGWRLSLINYSLYSSAPPPLRPQCHC